MRAPGVLRGHGPGRGGAGAGLPRGHGEDAAVPRAAEAEELPEAAARARRQRRHARDGSGVMKAKFDELLPFYVNGSLSEADRVWVEDYLRQHPGAAAELHWYESLQGRL